MVTMLMAATVINEHLAETVLPFSSLQTMTFILSEVTHTNHICTCSPFFHLLMQKNVCNRRKMQHYTRKNAKNIKSCTPSSMVKETGRLPFVGE